MHERPRDPPGDAVHAELAALRAELSVLRKVVSQCPSVLFEWRRSPPGERTPDGAGGRFTFASDALERLAGVRPEEVRGPQAILAGLVEPEVRRAFFAALDAAERTLGPFRRELVWGREGQRRHALFSAMPERDAGGELVWHGVITDIDDLARAREALRRSEERYELALRATAEGLWDWDVRTGEVHRSDRFLELVGHRRETLPDTFEAFERLLHEDDLDRARAALTAHLERRTPYDITYRLRTASGEVRWYRSRGQAAWDAEGRPTRMAGAIADVTEARAIEAALREGEQRLEVLTQAAFEGIAVSEAGVLIEANDQLAALLGHDRAALTGLPVQELVAPESRAHVLENMARGGEAPIEHLALRRDGTRVPVEIQARRLPYKGRTVRVTAVRDLTRQKAADEALRASEARYRALAQELERRVEARTAELALANRELEAFAYAVSHDLRAPLRAINGFARALVEDCAGALDDTGRMYLERVLGASEGMGRLIDDLLALSRVMRRTEIVRGRVDVSALAASVLQDLARAAPGRRVELVVEPGVAVEADPGLTRIVLTNLLGNAWKFTARRPVARIGVRGELRGGRRFVVVEDDGAGFDPAFAHRLFAPFQRLHSAGEFEGNGIGLATVQRVVQRHGGEIHAAGQVERGATFAFTLEPA